MRTKFMLSQREDQIWEEWKKSGRQEKVMIVLLTLALWTMLALIVIFASSATFS